ncbi:MAG TPA: ATP synthase subunit I [Candidatus Tectomicrobia bacterium]|nr:ATP synthase subunit I [Candidatus Tectomicrobia bacterium]
MAGNADLLRRVEWYGWALTSLLTAGALVARYPLVASGCAIGGALSVLHFKWLAMFLTAVVDPQRRPTSRIKRLVLGAYFAKYLIIVGVVYLLFRYGVVEPLGFLGGLSVIFVAICCAGVRRSKPLGEPQR